MLCLSVGNARSDKSNTKGDKKMKRLTAIMLVVLCLAMAGCSRVGTESSENSAQASSAASGETIYFLNFKPEVAEVYEEIAKEYEAETGVKVKVSTAAANTYETTLKSEIAKKDAPTIFQVNGPTGYESWKSYCADLKNTELNNILSDKSLAITEGDGVYGIPYVVEGYGIIYNQAIMDKYFSLSGAKASSMDEINNFAKLKEVVEDMTAKKDELGIKGVFASTSMASGEQWRWTTHLANVPAYYELAENEGYDNTILAGLNTSDMQFKYADNFKNTFDLYINNSVSDKGLLSSKSVSDSMAEFALGQCAMVQNGNWSASQILDVSGNTVSADDIKFLPIYTGMDGEEAQGLCIGTENYLCINKNVSEEKQKASEDFLVWLFSSEKGKDYVVNRLGFISPFNTFTEEEMPEDPLAKEVIRWMNKDGVQSIPWTFAAFPSEEFKNYFGAALLEYTQGAKSFDEVKKTFTESWASEYALSKR